MVSQLKPLFRFVRWGLVAGVASAIALGLEVLPALAAELTDWSYDSQRRSLTLTLPPDVLPSVSVISPEQLLIELPDTQIGEVPRLTVGDGVVDSIELEQISSDTLWVVMEFADGTELLGEQSAVPVGEVAGAGRQWEIRPNAIAADESTTGVVTSGGAALLRTPEVEVSQADFPDLPILEPGIQLDQPVSVPPIGSASDAVPPPPPPPPPPTAEPSSPVVSVPSVPEEVPISADVPLEPPFLGEETFEVPVVDRAAQSEESLAAEETFTEEVPVVDATGEDRSVVEADGVPVEPTVEADFVPGDAIATGPSARARADASVVDEPVPFGEELDSTDAGDFAEQGVVPQNTTDRWPEPIPFGAPLP